LLSAADEEIIPQPQIEAMLARFTLAVLVLLTLRVALSVIRIERLNAEAGHYLPRHDEDGKWRISRENIPCDQLRGLIQSVGLWQYLAAPGVIGLAAILYMRRRKSPVSACVAVVCGLIGGIALLLVFYRGYFTSLGT
jgi:hypothetical protein